MQLSHGLNTEPTVPDRFAPLLNPHRLVQAGNCAETRASLVPIRVSSVFRPCFIRG